MWKENILEDLEAEETEYESAREFLVELKREFGGGDEKVVKVAELRKLEQEGRTMEEFVQEFKWVVRESRYKRRLLIEEFKRGINEMIWRKLIEAECYDLKLKVLSDKTTLVLSNTRELDRVPSTE